MSRLLSGLVIVAVLLAAASPASAQLVVGWEAQFGGLNANIAYDVQPASDGGFVAAGFGAQGNFEYILMVKTDGQGQLAVKPSLVLPLGS